MGTLNGIKANLKITERTESMKKIIDLDTMRCIGYFSKSDSKKVLNRYNDLYDFCEFDIDGDLTVSNDSNDY